MVRLVITRGQLELAPIEAVSFVKRTLKDEKTGQDVECIAFLSEEGNPIANVPWLHFVRATVLWSRAT